MNIFDNSLVLPSLPPFLEKIVATVAEQTQTPPEMTLGMLFPVIGTVIQGKIQIMPHAGHAEPMAMWSIIASPSGTRKSTVMRHLIAPLQKIELADREQTLAYNRENALRNESSESRIKALRRRQQNAPRAAFDKINSEVAEISAAIRPMQVPLALMCQETTEAALFDELSTQKGERIGVFDTEGGFFSNATLGKISFFLKCYSGDYISNSTRSHGKICLQAPQLSLCIAMQNEMLKRIMKNPLWWSQGFFPRTLTIFARDNLGTRKILPSQRGQEDLCLWEQKIRSLHNIPWREDGKPHSLYFTSDALQRWHSASEWVENELRNAPKESELKALAGRLPGLITRLAGAIHCLEAEAPLDHPIQIEAVEWAIEIVKFSFPHMQRLHKGFFPDHAHTAAVRVARWLAHRQAPLTSFTLKDVYRNANISRDLAFTALNRLLEFGVVAPSFHFSMDSNRKPDLFCANLQQLQTFIIMQTPHTN